jgi:ATP-binding protein involved in chromosome partitioning
MSTCSPEQSCGACGTAEECDANAQQRHMEEKAALRLSRIRHRIAVMSGKGGVGKSTVAVNLAVALARNGSKVGILDGDVHGPNIPKMLGLDPTPPPMGPNGLIPPRAAENLHVISMGFLLQNEDTPVAWRGPMKHNLFQQFLAEVDWGDLDYLLVDLPPGTGDEPMSIAQILGPPLWSVIVTTPQDVALLDSRKSVVFGQTLDMNVLGIIENMSGMRCPHCGEAIDLFKIGGGEKAAADLGVPFLGAVPLDPDIVAGGDAGRPITISHPDSAAAGAFDRIVLGISQVIEATPGVGASSRA